MLAEKSLAASNTSYRQHTIALETSGSIQLETSGSIQLENGGSLLFSRVIELILVGPRETLL